MNCKILINGLLAIAVLTGCLSYRLLKEPVDNGDEVSLSEAAAAANNQYQRYVDSVSHGQGVSIHQNNDRLPLSLSRPISINWSGPVQEMLEQVSHDIGYHVKFFGKPPALPLLVDIDAENIRVIDLIRQVQAQTNDWLSIDIDASAHIVSVYYKASARG